MSLILTKNFFLCKFIFSNLEEVPYYLSGFKLCQASFQTVIGISDYSFNMTLRDFFAGTRQLQSKRATNLTEKRLQAENWMEQHFNMVMFVS